jgi:glycosyltransferase involved in cell wall biosynthesis
MAGDKPRVGLSAHLLSSSSSYRGAGVSHYVEGLLAHLPFADPAAEYVALLGAGQSPIPGWDCRIARHRTENPLARIFWEQAIQPREARLAGLDLLHAPVYVGPLCCAPCPLVVTVHDLSFYLFPELFRPQNRLYLQSFTRATVRRAAHVIADSESTCNDVVRLLGVPRSKVTVIPVGIGEEMRPVREQGVIDQFRRQRHLPDKVILFLGTLEPRKNIPALLSAYALLRQRHKLEHRLVLAGGKGWYTQEIERSVHALGLEDAVSFPGFVPQSELPLWYNAAELFVYPSLYEGFGLPPLEAMACGTPVIVSTALALTEVVSTAGIQVDPHDTEALAQAMWTLLSDGERRSSLRQAGLERAQGYSWSRTAQETAKVYHMVLGD